MISTTEILETLETFGISNLATSVILFLSIIITLIEKSRLATKPLSSFLKWWGDKTNAGIKEDLVTFKKEVNDKIDKSENARLRDRAISRRTSILRFGDEIANGATPSLEYYRQVINDIDAYEKYCTENKDFENSYATVTISIIRESLKTKLSDDTTN